MEALKNQPSQSFRDGKDFRDRLADGGFGPKMVWIPAGSFRMGDIQGGGYGDEQPVHEVSVGRFAMGQYEVTVSEFKRFVKATGYKTDAEKKGSCWTWDDNNWGQVKGANWRNPNFSQSDKHPVACVSWNDGVAYAEWLSEQTGQTYRLPTEAEWEYAARAGTETARYWGNDPDKACGYANVHDNTSKKENGFSWAHHNCTDGYAQTAPVGQFKQNKFGLYDMLGNLWEWTCSQYENKYGGKEQRCAKNVNENNRFSLRGGSWYSGPSWMRSANRYDGWPPYRYDDVGFRLARL
ncbi:hypothetical protein PN36_30200 [Candidatus Thiomargarita nelsonii]|uniref:Sulfatase-modifying factor enzyme-like domain-containing protein n=1 Tax=Candidatus Thiomargarita nelsonii TaxID=1003181 RepID=A0A4E0QLG4_9GAMM|nr:hypothetical protein PN36_30200 [Candidatus Thiomargarita nelsonii]